MSSQVAVKPKSACFRIRRIYFNQIKDLTKNIEFRSDSSFWNKRLFNPMPDIAVFVCGKDVLRRRIIKTEYSPRYEVVNHLGQEDIVKVITELNLDDKVIGVHLGDVIPN